MKTAVILLVIIAAFIYLQQSGYLSKVIETQKDKWTEEQKGKGSGQYAGKNVDNTAFCYHEKGYPLGTGSGYTKYIYIDMTDGVFNALKNGSGKMEIAALNKIVYDPLSEATRHRYEFNLCHNKNTCTKNRITARHDTIKSELAKQGVTLIEKQSSAGLKSYLKSIGKTR